MTLHEGSDPLVAQVAPLFLLVSLFSNMAGSQEKDCRLSKIKTRPPHLPFLKAPSHSSRCVCVCQTLFLGIHTHTHTAKKSSSFLCNSFTSNCTVTAGG